jgi:hypothetical protein
MQKEISNFVLKKNMPDKNKHRKLRFTDFLRYHKDEMTGEECNAFERELQKDPFKDEASEGYASISPEEALRDFKEISNRLKKRTVKRQKLVVYRIAASVAVLMVISAIYFLAERNYSGKKLSDISDKSAVMEITEAEPIRKTIARVETPENPDERELRSTGKSSEKRIITETGIAIGKGEEFDLPPAQPVDRITEDKSRIAERYAAGENNAAPGVFTASEKVAGFKMAKTMEAESDFQPLRNFDSSASALSERSVVGYGIARKDQEKHDTRSVYTPPEPAAGKAAFENYISENIHQPDSTETGQRFVVVLSFLVHTDGRIDSIGIIRSPGKSFSDEAIRLIKSGPAWNAAVDDGKAVEDRVIVSIVFR